MPSSDELKRKMKALDKIDGYLDDRDASDGRRLKEGKYDEGCESEAESDDSGLNQDASPPDNENESSGSDGGKANAELKADLRKMLSGNPGAKSVLELLREDGDEGDDEEEDS